MVDSYFFDFFNRLRININMQVFKMPKVFGSERLDTVISLLNSFRFDKAVTIDWKNLESVEPAGYAILSIIIDQAIEKECRLIHKNISSSLKIIIPEEIFNQKKTVTFPIPAVHDRVTQTFFHLCCQGGIDLRYKQLIEDRFSHLDQDLQFSIQLVFNELIQNSVDHSTSERYYIYFGLIEEEIHFGVLDMGVSLPAKMEQKYEAESDVSFLELSLKEGISTRRQRSGGLGLFHTFEIIKNLDGKFVFISRDGQIRRYFAQRKVNRLKLKNRLHGTWVMFTFKNQKAYI